MKIPRLKRESKEESGINQEQQYSANMDDAEAETPFSAYSFIDTPTRKNPRTPLSKGRK